MPRKRYSAEEKAKIALEALRGQKTVNEIATAFGVHPNQVSQWKKQAIDELPQVFLDHRGKHDRAEAELQAQLYQEIGQLKFELDWLKKKAGVAERLRAQPGRK